MVYDTVYDKTKLYLNLICKSKVRIQELFLH